MTVSSCLRHILTLSVFFFFAEFCRHIPRSVFHMPLTFSVLELASKVQAESSFPQGLKTAKKMPDYFFLSFINIFKRVYGYLKENRLPSSWFTTVFQYDEEIICFQHHIPTEKSPQLSSDWESHRVPLLPSDHPHGSENPGAAEHPMAHTIEQDVVCQYVRAVHRWVAHRWQPEVAADKDSSSGSFHLCACG